MASLAPPVRSDTAPWTSEAALAAVRPQVQGLLTAIPAFAALAPDEQRRLARDMVKVMSYIADPNAVAADVASAAREAPLAGGLAQADSVKNFQNLTKGLPEQVGRNFEAGAVRQGVEQFGEMVQKVDFPKFVGGLIKNVFQAIVESSIEQMRAYGELVANVAKSVDQFMTDNIGEGEGRDFLANKYPDDLALDANASAFEAGADTPPPRLVATGENSEERLGAISLDLNLNPPITDLSEEGAEQRLVTAARLQLARQRQQLLSSMVMLGINRIVVTDGSINAKVVFDMRASDTARQENRASMFDRQRSSNRNTSAAGLGGLGWGVGSRNVNTQDHVATVGSAVDQSSESKAEVKAKLSGDVRVNFKSDYLPLEKMATPEMMSVISGNSTPYNPNRPAPAAGGTPTRAAA